MPGVLLGVRRVIGRAGLTIGLDQVMGLLTLPRTVL